MSSCGTMTELLPWHREQWTGLNLRREAGRLPHALLFAGPAGVGKLHAARLLAASLLCEAPGAGMLPCGECRACRQVGAGTHPDLLEATPEEEGKQIRVDQVRAIGAFAATTAQYSGRKVVLLHPADRLNLAASNSLLKTLEEPGAASVLILVSDRPDALLPTIRSRCQSVRFTADAQRAADWLRRETMGSGYDPELLLALAGGAPLTARALAEADRQAARSRVLDMLEALARGEADPVTGAADLLKLGLETSIHWMQRWAEDLVRARMQAGVNQFTNRDRAPALQGIGERVDLQWLFGFLDRLTEARRLLRGQPNAQLLLEGLLISWYGGTALRRKSPRT